jgi:hypothetical protein
MSLYLRHYRSCRDRKFLYTSPRSCSSSLGTAYLWGHYHVLIVRREYYFDSDCLCSFLVGDILLPAHKAKVELSLCRSQWPRSLRIGLPSPAQTLGSCVRIPLEPWMSVCVFSVFVLSLCASSGLATGWSPVKRVLPCKKSRNWKRGQGPTKGCRAIDR